MYKKFRCWKREESGRTVSWIITWSMGHTESWIGPRVWHACCNAWVLQCTAETDLKCKYGKKWHSNISERKKNLHTSGNYNHEETTKCKQDSIRTYSHFNKNTIKILKKMCCYCADIIAEKRCLNGPSSLCKM